MTSIAEGGLARSPDKKFNTTTELAVMQCTQSFRELLTKGGAFTNRGKMPLIGTKKLPASIIQPLSTRHFRLIIGEEFLTLTGIETRENQPASIYIIEEGCISRLAYKISEVGTVRPYISGTKGFTSFRPLRDAMENFIGQTVENSGTKLTQGEVRVAASQVIISLAQKGEIASVNPKR